jgi:hypothetical protein
MGGRGLDSYDSGLEKMVGSFVQGKEPLGLMKCRDSLTI